MKQKKVCHATKEKCVSEFIVDIRTSALNWHKHKICSLQCVTGSH